MCGEFTISHAVAENVKVAIVILSVALLAGIGKTSRFLDRQAIHVGAQHHGRTIAVAEQADDAGLAELPSSPHNRRREALRR